ncbi:MAG: hypothetical protein M3300_11430, partial [Actinomycetota bacterium]|nr:hypothetical protein [Actinomycetota bacterium]
MWGLGGLGHVLRRRGKRVAAIVVVAAVLLVAVVAGLGVGLGVTMLTHRLAASSSLTSAAPPAPVVPRLALR